MQKPNRVTSQARLRHYVYQLGVLTLILFVFSKFYRSYYEEYYSDSTKPAPPYNEYIDKAGQYLPYSGYKILQLVKSPLSAELFTLDIHLSQQTELTSYFRLVPTTAYHVTLTHLKNKTLFDDKKIATLNEEQELLDKDITTVACYGKQILLIDKHEIRLEVEGLNSQFSEMVKQYQKRWDEKFPKLITHHYKSFYITLAHQYQTIPDKDTYSRLEQVLKQWESYPIEIQLDPIEICLYTNLITYSTVVPDEIITEQ